MRCELAVSRRGLAAAAVLAGVLLLPAPVGAAKTAPKPENPTALPAPAIPGVPALPGAEASPATLSSSVKPLNVIPLEGVTGTPVTISDSGLPANKPVTVTWSTTKVTWEVDPRVDSVDYLGLAPAERLNVVLATATTDASGSFRVSVKAPDDFGGLHEVYAVVEGVQLALGGFTIDRSATISPKKGPIGTPITITYHGLGASLFEGGAALNYDNHFTGAVTAYWTRGTAEVKIRASGPVGKHTIEIADAITFTYLNIQQSPIPWATGRVFSFTVTKDRGRPKPDIEWPVNVAPTLGSRTTLQASAVAAGSTATATLTPTSGPVQTSIEVAASGLANEPVTLTWLTVLGSRVNCPKSTCWNFVTVPLNNSGAVTPSGGSLKTTITAPEGLGGWHAVQLTQGGKVVAQAPFYVKRSVVGNGVSSLVLKQGQPFTVHLKGLGWTQLDNTIAVDYDNSYIGYGCGFNSNGDTVMNLVASGAPGTHLIDMYPLLYNSQPAYANTPYGVVPMLTFAKDRAGPSARLRSGGDQTRHHGGEVSESRAGWAVPSGLLRAGCSPRSARSALLMRARRAIGFGSHQFQEPSTAIRLGTSSTRTIVASSSTASARPAPNSCRPATRPATNPENAATMIAAAAVMIRPVRCNPSTTARRLSWCSSQDSRMRVTRNTS